MFCTLWRYSVPPERVAAFEQLYGPGGGWVALFRRDAAYLHTELLRDPDLPQRFLTIDTWLSREAYEAFRQAHRAEFEALDRQGETLTTSEEPLGGYEAGSACDERIARAVQQRCVEAAREAYEAAGVSGLCAEGRWECALAAVRNLDLGEQTAADRSPGEGRR